MRCWHESAFPASRHASQTKEKLRLNITERPSGYLAVINEDITMSSLLIVEMAKRLTYFRVSVGATMESDTAGSIKAASSRMTVPVRRLEPVPRSVSLLAG